MPLTINPIINSKHNPTFTPTPTSISTTQSPSSLISTPTPAKSQIWPLSLRTIKHLYISHHYRQCIARVEDLLPLTEEPIHKTYLTFYTAMSYEGMGLAAHNYSKNKLPLLQAAVEWFVVCRAWVVDASVASDTSVREEGGRDERDRDKHRYSDTDSEYEDTDKDKGDTLERSITQMIQGIDLHGRDPFEDDPFIDREDSDPELDLDRENAGDEWMAIQALDSHSDTFQDSSSPTLNDSDSDSDTPNNSYITDSPNEPIYTSTEQGLIPSPLKVRKASGESFEAEILRQSGLNLDPDLEHVQIQESFSQYRKLPSVGGSRFVPPLPVRVIPASTTTPGYHSGSGYSSSSSSGGVYQNHHQHYLQPQSQTNNSNQKKKEILNFLQTQIKSSITTLHTHINEITALQEARRMSRGMRRSGSFWSFSPVKSSSSSSSTKGNGKDIGGGGGGGSGRIFSLKETKAQRIERLRGEGWRTVGIRSPRLGWKGEEYYRGFCEGVLDELYLGLRSSG